jgi:hypothetical protein
MTKLYEILAVESDLRKKAADLLKATIALFGQPGKFIGRSVSAHAILEDEPELFPENTDIANSVGSELSDIEETFGAYVDVTVQKELSNTRAFADVQIDGATIFEHLSATALLNLESRLSELEALYIAIPTLDVTERWQHDDDQGCYVSGVRTAYRTKKVPKPMVLYDATVEHPAQVQVFTEEIPAYRIESFQSSGMLTPADKQMRLERLAKLAVAVKQARQRANDTEIEPTHVACKIFDYVNRNHV